MMRGEYKVKDSSGNPTTYIIGDEVFYQGKLFKCVIPTYKSPLQKPDSWIFTGITENTVTENPPIKPFKGQMWTSSKGTSYIWFEDTDGSQWVET